MIEGESIGIDFGTTFSCVGVWQNNVVKIIPTPQGNHITPSIVAFTEKGILVGDTAKNQAAMNITNTVANAKHLIGCKFNDHHAIYPFDLVPGADEGNLCISVLLNGKQKIFTMEEICSMFLSNMKHMAEGYIGKEVKNAVIAVPNHFGKSQRQAIRNAADIAGLSCVRIITETSATAIAYIMNIQLTTIEKHVLIFDLGGGSLSVSVLMVDKETTVEVKAVAGVNMGGEDFVNRMVEHFCQEFQVRFRKNMRGNRHAINLLHTACEGAKRRLSSKMHANIEVESLYEYIDFSSTITRALFEEMNMNHFRQCMECVERVICDSRVSKSQIDDVVLVGRSTYIPKLKSMLSDYFGGKELCERMDPDETVASGAAALSASLFGNFSKCEKLNELLLLDATSCSYGVETFNGDIATLIQHNTTIPAKKSRAFHCFPSETISQKEPAKRPKHEQAYSGEYNIDYNDRLLIDENNQVTIQIFERERCLTSINNLLGKFKLDVPAVQEGGHLKIDITFEIRSDEAFHVAAYEESTGNGNTWYR